MNAVESFSIAASSFSILLAVFAIWLALQQRKESQNNYMNTKSVLAEIEKAMEKTGILVSENFQNLLKSVTDQQQKMLDSLTPRQSPEEKYAELFTGLAQNDPEKLQNVVDAIIKMQKFQHGGT